MNLQADNVEREQTDESLRVERAEVDSALGEALTAVDECADAVISRARGRADEALAKARAQTDRQAATSVTSAIIGKERAREDRDIRKERSAEDESLREERVEHSVLLAVEREETDKDLLSERVRSDEALTTRDDFMGIVSHELRNMLGVIIGFASMLERERPQEYSTQQVRQYAQNIRRSGDRMNRLIGDLVDGASIEAGMLALAREVADPAPIVTEAVTAFQARAAAEKITLVTEIIPPLPPLLLDTARILQVLSNLLSNAIKFTPAGGTIVVRVERSGSEIRFAVSDTGEGIPADMLEAVFDRFVQVTRSDRRGLGLGLYISRCILQGHGGKIRAENRPGGGSTFSFNLPVHAAPAVPAADNGQCNAKFANARK